MQKLSLEIITKISGGTLVTPGSDDYDGDPGLSDDQRLRSGSSGPPFIPPVEEPDPLDDYGNETM